MNSPLLAPLDDPAYTPQHPPLKGEVPHVVALWGPRSQLRWFRRFADHLKPRRDWGQYYIHSLAHTGPCCSSCEDEYQAGTGVMMDGRCCCRERLTP